MIAAFIGGTLFGMALCSVFAVLWIKKGSTPKLIPVQKRDDWEERIALQWQNMAVYDGTEKGQQEVR